MKNYQYKVYCRRFLSWRVMQGDFLISTLLFLDETLIIFFLLENSLLLHNAFSHFLGAVPMLRFSYIEKKVFKYFHCSSTTARQKALLPQFLIVFAYNKVFKPQLNLFFHRSGNLSYTFVSISTFPSFYPGKFLCHPSFWADLSIRIHSRLPSCSVFPLTASETYHKVVKPVKEGISNIHHYH